MKTLVVYQSSTGFTEQYAKWIAEDLSCRAVSLKETTQKEITEQDLVIFGGWIMGGMVNGLEKVKKMSPSKLVIFAVGATPGEIMNISAMKEENHVSQEPFFYLTGGFRFEKINFLVRGMLKTLKKSVAKKENKTPQEQFMADSLGTSFETADRNYITPLVEYVRTLK